MEKRTKPIAAFVGEIGAKYCEMAIFGSVNMDKLPRSTVYTITSETLSDSRLHLYYSLMLNLLWYTLAQPKKLASTI